MKYFWDKPALLAWCIRCGIMRRWWCHTTTRTFIEPTNTFINCCNRSASSTISILLTTTFTPPALSFGWGTTLFIFLCRLLIRMCSLNLSLSLYICFVVFKYSTFRNPLIPTVYITIVFIISILLEIDNVKRNLTSYSILHNEWNI